MHAMVEVQKQLRQALAISNHLGMNYAQSKDSVKLNHPVNLVFTKLTRVLAGFKEKRDEMQNFVRAAMEYVRSRAKETLPSR